MLLAAGQTIYLSYGTRAAAVKERLEKRSSTSDWEVRTSLSRYISGQKIRYAGYYSLVNQPTRIKLDIIQKASHSLVDPTQSEAV